MIAGAERRHAAGAGVEAEDLFAATAISHLAAILLGHESSGQFARIVRLKASEIRDQIEIDAVADSEFDRVEFRFALARTSVRSVVIIFRN